MLIRQSVFRSKARCKFTAVILALSWCTGLGAGICVSLLSRVFVVDVFRNAVRYDSSFFGSFAVAVLPITSAVIWMDHRRWIIPLVSLFKGFSLGFCGYSLGSAFGSGSWLILPMFLFIDMTTVPVCYFFWLRYSDASKEECCRAFGHHLVYCIIIASIDHFIVSPFLSGIFR